MNEATDRNEEREKREERARIIALDVREVSLVDRAANEREFLVVKNLGGDEMNEETKAPIQHETEVQKALELSKQLVKEQADALKGLVAKLAAGDLAEDTFEAIFDLMYSLRKARWISELDSEGKAKKPDDYPYPNPEAEKAEVEKAGASLAKARELCDKAIGMVGDNKDLAAVLGELKSLLAGMGKYPYPNKTSKEDAVKTEKTETKVDDKAETKVDDKAETKTTEKAETTDVEKRSKDIEKLIGELESQRKSLDDAIGRVNDFLAKAGGKKPDEEEPEEMKGNEKALAEKVEKQAAEIAELRKTLDGIVKTRGTSKAADEPDPTKTEDRAKGSPVKWDNVL